MLPLPLVAIAIPGPPRLELGMRVAVAAHSDLDLAQREHVVVDSVKVLADPPGYVRKGPTRAGHFLYWESRCVSVTIDGTGTIAISGDAGLHPTRNPSRRAIRACGGAPRAPSTRWPRGRDPCRASSVENCLSTSAQCLRR